MTEMDEIFALRDPDGMRKAFSDAVVRQQFDEAKGILKHFGDQKDALIHAPLNFSGVPLLAYVARIPGGRQSFNFLLGEGARMEQRCQ